MIVEAQVKLQNSVGNGSMVLLSFSLVFESTDKQYSVAVFCYLKVGLNAFYVVFLLFSYSFVVFLRFREQQEGLQAEHLLLRNGYYATTLCVDSRTNSPGSDDNDRAIDWEHVTSPMQCRPTGNAESSTRARNPSSSASFVLMINMTSPASSSL